jgi:arylsulfatase A-like enzyme
MRVLSLLFIITTFVLPAFAGLEGSKPNIILVITDDQGYAPVGRHGHPWLKTPHLDALHDSSLRLKRFMVCPTCSPTRSALMTGRDPLKNGITHTIFERERMTLLAVTLPQVLKTVGYNSGIFGKWHLGDEAEYQPEKRGFDEAFIHGAGGIGQKYDCSCADAPDNKYTDPVIRHNGKFVKTHGFCTDVFFTAAMGWMKQQKDSGKPFFAYIATNAPHSPYIAPEKNAKRFTDLGFSADQAGFYGMVENIDENMGRMADKLKAWDLYKNTVVIFMSDNGMAPGPGPSKDLAPGYPFFNADHIGMKGGTDEGSVRVPFFIRWDGHIPAGKDVHTLAAHIDVFPTLASLAGASLPSGQVEGRSLLPLLSDTKAPWEDRFIYTHVARWPVGDEPDKHQWINYGVRNQKYRLVGPKGGGGNPKKGKKAGGKPAGEALYDMESDPMQTKNVISEHPDVVAKMKAAYDAFWKESRPMMVNEAVPMSPTKPYHVWYEEQLKNGGIPDWTPPQL